MMDLPSGNTNEETSDNAQNEMDQNTSDSLVKYSNHVAMASGTEIPLEHISYTFNDTSEQNPNAVFTVLPEPLSQKSHEQEVQESQIVTMVTDDETQQETINRDIVNVSKGESFYNMVTDNANLFVVESQNPNGDLTQQGETVAIVTSDDIPSDVIDQNVDADSERTNKTLVKSLETGTENFPQGFTSYGDATVTMVTDSDNSWYELNQNIADQEVIEVRTEKVKPGSTPILKIMKIVDQVQHVQKNTVESHSGKIVLDDAVLQAILLATSNNTRKAPGHPAADENIADTTEVISYEDGSETVITIVHSDNEIQMDASEIVTENDLSSGYIENVSEEGLQQIGTSENDLFDTIKSGNNKTCAEAVHEKTESGREKGNNSSELLQKSVYEIEKGKGPVHILGGNSSRSDNSEEISSKDRQKEMSRNSDGLYNVKLTLDDLCNVINENTELVNSDLSCTTKSTGVQTSDITESYTHCEICNKFIRKHYFKHHYSFHTGEKKYSCDICNKAFMTSQHLRRHQVVHSKEKPFPCELCGNCYTQKAHLKIHMRTHNGERNYHCKICNKSFFQSQNLKRHMISHSSDRPYNCKSCDKTFKFKDHLIDHERLHSEKPLYECDVCKMPYKTRSALFTHKISHSPEKMAKYKKFQNRKKEKKNFSCTSCSKSFMMEKSFNSHKCSENKSYLCDICSRYFMSRVSLLRHCCRKAELDELPRSHSCMTCGEHYYSEHMLREHQLHTHIKNATFSCEICGCKIVQDQISSHLESHVGQQGRYKCHCCEEEFSKTELLKQHVSLHLKSSENGQDDSLFNCSVCSKSYKSMKCLANHMNRHIKDENEYQCHICSFEFKSEAELNKHLRSHSDSSKNTRSDYECEVCHKRFVQAATYEKHVKIHRGIDKMYKCHFCSEQFSEVKECRQHIFEKTCSKARSIFKCKFCNRQYNKCLFLNEHLKKHLGSGDIFKCIDCPKHFQDSADLKKHCQIHTKTLHECSLCKRCFNDKWSLDRHIEQHTGSNNLYKCAECIEEFNNKERLLEHVKSNHKINVIVQQNIVKNSDITKPSCQICGKYFCNQWRLKRHLQCFAGKTKFYRCHKCPEEFDEMGDAKLHMDEIHGNDNIKKQMTDSAENDSSDTEKIEGENVSSNQCTQKEDTIDDKKRKVGYVEKEKSEAAPQKKGKVTVIPNSDESGEKPKKEHPVKNDNKTINKRRSELNSREKMKRSKNINDEKPKQNKADFKRSVTKKRKSEAEQEDIGTRRSQRKSQRPSYLSIYVDQNK